MKIACDELNGCDYFTIGKRYTVMETVDQDNGTSCYKVLDDNGVPCHVVSKNCPHIVSNWRIVEHDDNFMTPEEEEEWGRVYDNVNSPRHYQLLPGVEVKDVRMAILNKIPEGIPYTQIDDWSRAWEYITRMWDKNGLEDAKKARVYLNWLIEKMEEDV